MRKARRRPSLIRRLSGPLTIIAAIALAVAIVTAVTRHDDRTEISPSLTAAALAGRQAAQSVAGTPAGSMARESAILEIRARETDIRRSGFEAEADTFAAEAAKILDTLLQ
ncbi:MAG: hypothetical protein K2J38_05125 [Muribaculaceae bacterium]|nr:hypothetical protein [Muribaculaceae bacterium]